MTDAREGFTTVVGNDGSDAARRGLERAHEVGGEASIIVVVAVVPDLRSPSLGAALSTRAFDPEGALAEARLLIVGRRGGDFVARTLLGSVAQRVVEHAPCDILVVL